MKGSSMIRTTQPPSAGPRANLSSPARRTLTRGALPLAALALLALLTAAGGPAIGGDDRIRFRYRLQPETTYEQTMTMSMVMEVGAEGIPEEMAPALQAMFSDMKQEIRLTTLMNVGRRAEDGSMPVEMQIGKMEATVTVAGQVMPLPGLATATQGEMIRGRIRPDGRALDLEADAVEGVPPDAIDRLMQSMPAFPEAGIAVGESFEIPTEISVPLPALAGGSVVDMAGRSVFELKRVGGGEAGFDLTHRMSLDMEAQESAQVAMEMEGEGRGIATFHLEEGFFTRTSVDLEMIFKIGLAQMAGGAGAGSGSQGSAPAGPVKFRIEARGPLEITMSRRGREAD
jgi:hypothetical protein